MITQDISPTQKQKQKKKKLLITLWIHVISIFVITNYVRSYSCWPSVLLRLPLRVWNLIHGLSAMVFAGSIVTTTVLEWNYYNQNNIAFFPELLRVETSLVLPALTGSMISGVAQAFHSYSSLRYAPRHVKSALHLLLAFGVWWGLTDRRSQGKVLEASIRIAKGGEIDETVLRGRRISNVVSCLFLLVMYSVMILKPGYSSGAVL
jgi:hypothetical protein